MEDAEQVAVVEIVVDLWPLALREDVLDVERVPPKARTQRVHRLRIDRRVEVNPGEAVGAELSDARFGARCDRLCEAARSRPPDAGQARHRY